jgi:hypothetical protein
MPQTGSNLRTNTRPDQKDQKCYVCKKIGCWSTKHSDEDRTKAYARLKEQLVTEIGMNEDNLAQFLTDYEGYPNEESSNVEDVETLENKDPLYEHFVTELGEVNGAKTVSALNDQSVRHIMTKQDIFHSYETLLTFPYEMSVFTFEERYSSAKFQGIMPDTGAAGISTAGEPQFLALQKQDLLISLDRTTAGDNQIRFGKGTAVATGTTTVRTPLGPITFHIVTANTPFLFCIQDMDRMKVRFDNLANVLIQGQKIVPIVRKWGHPWMLLDRKEEAMAYSHLTEPELRQLHRRFGHPSVRKLTQVLERAGYDDIDSRTIEHLTKFCKHCQLHAKSPGRFKFTLKEDIDFNYSVIIDILYLNGKPVLQAVDEATAFNAARFLKDVLAKTT